MKLSLVLIMLVFFSMSNTKATDSTKSTQLHQTVKTELLPPIELGADDFLFYYQMMKDIDELFSQNRINYWVIAGTLLGAVRHKGMIPWDHDIDICIMDNEVKSLLSLSPQLNKLGYQLVDTGDNHIIYITAEPNWHHIDILVTEKIGNKYFYKCTNLNTILPLRQGLSLHFEQQELLPLKRYLFGAISVMGPANPHPWLTHVYGENYMTHAAAWSLPPDPSKLIKLENKDKDPGQPIGPLENRVQKILMQR